MSVPTAPQSLPECTFDFPHRSRSSGIARSLLFSNILVPDGRILRDIFREHLDALEGSEVNYFGPIFAEPIDPAAEVHRLSDHNPSNAELADQAAAIRTRGQGRDHDFVAITAVAAGAAKRIGFTVRRRIAFLNSAVVPAAEECAVPIKERRADWDATLREPLACLVDRGIQHTDAFLSI